METYVIEYKFHPLNGLSRLRDPQLQVGKITYLYVLIHQILGVAFFQFGM